MQTAQARSRIMTKSYSKFKKESWEDFKEKLDLMKEGIDPGFLVEELGFKVERETPKELRAPCVIHGGDNTTAFRFNKKTRTWVCFTHRCHEQYGNDVVALIRAVKGFNFMGAVEWLKSMAGEFCLDDGYVLYKRKREMDRFVEENYENQKPRSVNENSLNDFKPLRSKYFLRQGFKRETLDLFEIAGGWKDSNDLIRDIIPIRDDKGELVAYSLRDIREGVDDDDFKYILTPGFNKQGCLYNLFRAQELASKKPLIVVEGFKSVWKLHELGIDNVVATMGAHITEGQQFLLYMYALNGIVMFYDNDSAGVEGTLKAIDDLSNKMTVRPVFIQEVDENGKGLDPADLSDRLIYDYLNTYY